MRELNITSFIAEFQMPMQAYRCWALLSASLAQLQSLKPVAGRMAERKPDSVLLRPSTEKAADSIKSMEVFLSKLKAENSRCDRPLLEDSVINEALTDISPIINTLIQQESTNV